jgi:ankyrin repeat protein
MEGYTALHHAVANGYHNTVATILNDRNTNPDALSADKKTALGIAVVETRDIKMVQLLLKYKANPRSDPRNLLEAAAQAYEHEILEALSPFYTSSERCALKY